MPRREVVEGDGALGQSLGERLGAQRSRRAGEQFMSGTGLRAARWRRPLRAWRVTTSPRTRCSVAGSTPARAPFRPSASPTPTGIPTPTRLPTPAWAHRQRLARRPPLRLHTPRRPRARLRLSPGSPRSGADRPRGHDAAPGAVVHPKGTGRSPQQRALADRSPPQRPHVGVSANRLRAACPCAARVGAPRTFGKPRNHRVRKPSERNRCSKSCGVVEHGNDATTCTRGEHIDASRNRQR